VSAAPTIQVVKCDAAGREVWRYPAALVEMDATRLVVAATFDRELVELPGLTLRCGDRFVETYFRDRWYNLYHIRAGADGPWRGWYCNISHPAEWQINAHGAGEVRYRDLALDVIVDAEGRVQVLDEDEFAALDLTPEERQQARAALAEVQALFAA
jgi:predicted RNA-binding protein associated with RNAse of E/G family